MIEIWPDNVPAFNLLIDLGTQWRTGMGGRTGLDYNVLGVLPRWQSTPAEQRQSLLDDLRTMEIAILNQDAEHRDQGTPK